MRYLGSKTLLVEKIYDLIDIKEKGMVFCDPFGGIGTVGAFMKQAGFCVISGDLLTFAHYFQKALIENNQIPGFNGIGGRVQAEEELNNALSKEGWFIEEYSCKRLFFSRENAGRIQADIDLLWKWRQEMRITEGEYAFLAASLINAMDKVANTAGTYYAHLKELYRKAGKPYRFTFLNPAAGSQMCRCYLEDANELVKNRECQVLYLDPPYNERDYGRYYHLPETIARGVIPTPAGKSGIYVSGQIKSQYAQKRKVQDAFSKLINDCRCEQILFHYTDNGLLDIEEARAILKLKGRVEEFYFDCKGYHTIQNSETNKHHIFKVTL